jgi:transposase
MGTTIKLLTKDKSYLKNFVKTGKRSSREIEHAYILLSLDKKKPYAEIMDFYEVSRATIWLIKNKYIKNGLEAALKDAPRSGQPSKYKEKEEAEIVALACTQAPSGRARWTLRLMEQELQKINGLETINRETIRLTLKKRNVSLG